MPLAQPAVTWDGVGVPPITSYNYLGVRINSALSLTAHVSARAAKARVVAGVYARALKGGTTPGAGHDGGAGAGVSGAGVGADHSKKVDGVQMEAESALRRRRGSRTAACCRSWACSSSGTGSRRWRCRTTPLKRRSTPAWRRGRRKLSGGCRAAGVHGGAVPRGVWGRHPWSAGFTRLFATLPGSVQPATGGRRSCVLKLRLECLESVPSHSFTKPLLLPPSPIRLPPARDGPLRRWVWWALRTTPGVDSTHAGALVAATDGGNGCYLGRCTRPTWWRSTSFRSGTCGRRRRQRWRCWLRRR